MIEAQLVPTTQEVADVPSDLSWVLEECKPDNHAESAVGGGQPRRTPTFFMHTPFARGVLSLFLHAKQNPTGHGSHALTRPRKTDAKRELFRCFPGEKFRGRQVQVPIVRLRAPNRD